jgi:hypothetical protein
LHDEGWQTPPAHGPEQQTVAPVHDAPVRAQLGAAVPQIGGLSPTQLLLAHSKLATHEIPSARGADVQSRRPVPSSMQAAPWQQSCAVTQMSPSGRQGPGPGSHLPVGSQTLLQQVPEPPEWQSSPDARQVAVPSIPHLPRPPSSTSHSFEQQSASEVQSEPSRRHSAPPHFPPLHPRSQQSLAREQDTPDGWHSSRQKSVVDPALGSHRPLQHCERDVHAAPAPAHVPGIAQLPAAQWMEQQSPSLPHGAPSA